MTESLQHSATWPTTIGATCIVVGGLTLFGGCLSLTGMGELEQLHTALPFGEPKLSESIREALVDTSPAAWVISSSSMLVILFSIALVALGMSLLQRNPRAIGRLKWWASLYIIFTITTVCLNWVPRLDLIQTDQPILALFLAQLMIYLPLYLLLPFFLLVYLNLAKVRNELKLWR